MAEKKRVLVTRVLTREQREKLAAFEIEETELISVRHKENASIPDKARNIIFTSKNSVIPLKEYFSKKQPTFERVFCVGEQTEKLLLQYGIVHVVRENSAEELAYKIIEEKIEKVDFFCGNLRREELPVILRENGIILTEHEVYRTEFTPLKFTNHFDAILFFSPSGVLSYISEQNSREIVAFCIGNTTAVEAIDYFENVYAAEEPSLESLIKSVIEYYKNE